MTDSDKTHFGYRQVEQDEKAGMVAAAYFFVGTEAPVQGIRPTFSYLYDEDVAGMTRVEQVLDWFALPDAERPHMVTLYFEEVDWCYRMWEAGFDGILPWGPYGWSGAIIWIRSPAKMKAICSSQWECSGKCGWRSAESARRASS